MAKGVAEDPANDGRSKRARSRRHPLRQGRPKGVWQPDLVGKVHGYPKTEEAYIALQERSRAHFQRLHAEGKLAHARQGVPDGWAGRKQEVEDIRAFHRAEAKEIVKAMVEQNIVSEDDKHAQEMLTELVAIVRDKETTKVRERIAAAGKVLEFTKAKPAQKVDATLNNAEAFLASLLPGANGPQAS